MTTIGWIRHGATEWNKLGRLQGQNDIPLSGEGREQAHLLAERLKKEHWDLIVSSDLCRARETAEIIAEKMPNVPVILDKRLRERTHGRLDGTTLEERIAVWGENWHCLDHGMETDDELYARGIACVNDLEAAHSGKNILVVSHGAFIAVMLRRMLERMPEGLLQNTSVSVIEKGNTGWHCRLFNCTKHLNTVR
jgi:probable phosphoglycerate mutase